MSDPKDPQAKHMQLQLAKAIDYKKTFGSEQGKRVLADLMANNFLYQTTFASTPHEMALREGSRCVVMQILEQLNVNPEKVRDMIRENLNGTS